MLTNPIRTSVIVIAVSLLTRPSIAQQAEVSPQTEAVDTAQLAKLLEDLPASPVDDLPADADTIEADRLFEEATLILSTVAKAAGQRRADLRSALAEAIELIRDRIDAFPPEPTPSEVAVFQRPTSCSPGVVIHAGPPRPADEPEDATNAGDPAPGANSDSQHQGTQELLLYAEQLRTLADQLERLATNE